MISKEKKQEYDKKYYADNRDRKCAISKAWYENNKEKRKKFLRTVYGVVQTIVNSQRSSSRKRGHPLPPWTFDEFYTYCVDHVFFCVLYRNWAASGFSRNLKPSVDRIDCLKPYSWDNIQFMTAYENLHVKGKKDMWRIRRLSE